MATIDKPLPNTKTTVEVGDNHLENLAEFLGEQILDPLGT